MTLTNSFIILFAIYVLVCVVFYFFQHFFFFRPELLPHEFTYKYPFDFEEKTFEMEDGGRINAIYFRVPNSRGVIYYLKGNSRSIKGWGKFAKDFVSNGYDFFMMDYRGFGKSRGKRTEPILYNDAQTLYRWLAKQYEEDEIVIYGRSMGSGIAARIASWNRPKMLILDSPYFSFYHQIRRYGFILPLRWLLRYQIRTDQFFRKIESPIFLIHGTKDRLIPFEHSERLQQIQPELAHLLPIEGGGHNDLPDYPEYHQYLYDILNGYYVEQTAGAV
ncbi:alpha/beta hydrolase [Flavilitoribacter nigricans]|uniref:Alpha/beta hydrolase n=1 Tax=Flavilitoribacter nigricans (strain ATCC 23147 / DSM 23189 / NBRC 102662 / NCIMB 1420 / SS-2) TaxID=1122177 RepID=A0A2D0N647_FLAN2|nr:alpha/beta fold hydrolase [Flavilitoribacter nigricans]PHN03975.1 alpha/beta hydrolase [Flavilitoribacter nigricans DSM 23189 = NBRC 102662]